MKLLMFRHDGDRRLGALRPGDEDEVVDLSEVAKDVLAVVDAGERGLEQARKAAKSAGRGLRLKDVTLLPPIDNPRGNIIAMGRNYQKHAEETASDGDVKPPTIFTKAITSITGPCDDIPIDAAISEEIDWEVELGVVIGKSGANIARSDAMNHVFGYFVLNDVSARDIQNGWGGQYFKGKSLDRSCPIGPWVVTKDDVPDPGNLGLRLTVNGVVKQEGSTRDMIHPVDSIIEWTSKGMTLLSGTLIATGTPDGVGFARKPPEFLHPGDQMETEVSGIGVLRNRMVAARVGALADHSHRGA
ncbi:MAG TPA: fumarylacetoacetate hydrolase family protein [Candidatus Dormibacteraeota bacterium]|nr:fumarylacetoacetate hydrolase family protein [Candidatus Dormibacteraeota bacterium]